MKWRETIKKRKLREGGDRAPTKGKKRKADRGESSGFWNRKKKLKIRGEKISQFFSLRARRPSKRAKDG